MNNSINLKVIQKLLFKNLKNKFIKECLTMTEFTKIEFNL